MMPVTDTQPKYGDLPVSSWHRWILAVTQNCGRGFLGHTLAHALRRIFILTHADTVDYTRDGIHFRFHLLDNVCERRYFFTPQFYDRAEHDFINEFLPAGGVFVDVGANVGIYSLWAAKKTGPSGIVLSIEPNEAALTRLRFNISVNPDLQQISVAAMGVGEKEGNFKLYLESTNLGGSSLVAKGQAPFIEVPCAPLPDILKKYNINRRIGIMKLDIEGYEENVLRVFFADAPESIFPDGLIIENSPDLLTGNMPAMLHKAGYRRFLQTRMNSIFLRNG